MDHDTKIGKLKAALLAGEKVTPLRAWEAWKMNSSTYHRSIWDLQHHEGLVISREMVTADNGVRHSVHWIEVNHQPESEAA